MVASVPSAGTKTAVAMLYISAGKEATYIGLPNGSYDLFLMHGQDWDAANATFTRQCAFYQVPKTFDFTATSTTYDVWTVTVTEDEAWRWRPLNADFPQ
jgi:hypothetical protein